MSGAGLGDEFGARDPTSTELQFGFSERVLYLPDTDHIRMMPSASRKYLGLATKRCEPPHADAASLSFRDAELLRKQVLDWKLTEEGASLCLCRAWSARDAECAAALASRLTELAGEEGYADGLACSGDREVTATLRRPGGGGVTECDFVLAAKLDSLDLSDLVVARPKRVTYY